jgi:hypothetical protein
MVRKGKRPVFKAEQIQIFERRSRVEKMILRGVTNAREIASAFGVGQKSIEQDIKEIHRRWRDDNDKHGELEELRIKRIRQLEALVIEAYNAYDQSKARKIETKTSQAPCDNCEGEKFVETSAGKQVSCPECLGTGEVEVEVQEETGRPGNPNYLKLIQTIVVDISKLEGTHPQIPTQGAALMLAAKKVGMDGEVVEMFASVPAELLLQSKRIIEDLKITKARQEKKAQAIVIESGAKDEGQKGSS